MTTTIKPFTIQIPQAQLDDLHQRLRQTIWPAAIEGQDYGGPKLARMKDLVRAATAFEWRKKETELNKLPHFITEVDGQDIHFIHVRSKDPGAVPLLLIHGWPGSFVEFVEHIQPLTAPEGKSGKPPQAFHVVIPSLPGFALSDATKDIGWNNARIGRALFELMHRLGYDKFGIQGGDAGAIIGPEMGRLAPDRLIGIHVNAATVGFIPMGPVGEGDLATFTPAEKRRLDVMRNYLQARFGYNVLQSHQPQLLGYALADSPSGLMAWMTQLMDPDEVGDDRFLTNFLLYWLTRTVASSMRLYYENAHDPGAWTAKLSSGVPTAVAVFGDQDVAIRRYAEAGNRIVRWTEYATGGHYAVMTVPEDWRDDVRRAFGELVT